MNEIIQNMYDQVDQYDRTIEINDLIEKYTVSGILSRMIVYYEYEFKQFLESEFYKNQMKE